MKLKDLGEDKVISWIGEFLGTPRGVTVPVGDDAAVIKVGNTYLATASDMIQETSHIYNGMSPYQAGKKVAVVNFSDLASMGSKPKGFLLSISISEKEEFSKFKEIFRGVEAGCQEVGAKFLGGDMNRGNKLILDGFAFGTIEKNKIMRRKGAKVGDIVAVTGYLGSAACGWQILQRSLDLDSFSSEQKRKIEKNIIEACIEPRARVKEGQKMAKTGYVTACTDISDGLAFSLGYMRDSCGFEIFEEKIPVRPEVDLVCEQFSLNRDQMVFNVGEDFELLCTIKPKKFDRLQDNVPGIVEIGRVVEGNKLSLIRKNGKKETIPSKGYNHFSQ